MTLPGFIATCRLTAAAVSLSLVSLPASAQRADTELARLRTDHEKGLASASRVIDDLHRLTLRQLERERVEAGDYEAAGKVKARLDVLEQAAGAVLLVPPPVTHTLLAARALTRDGANTEGGREYVDFRKTGGKAIWDVIGLGLENGVYEVFLTYAVGLPRWDASPLDAGGAAPREAPGGVIAFSEVTALGGGPAAPLEKRVTTTGAWENYIRESLGRHEFKNANATVKLEATKASEGGLLRLKQIELVKVVGGPGGGAVDDGAADSEPARGPQALQTLQARYRRSMQEAASSLRARFRGEYHQLAEELARSGDAAGAAAVGRLRDRLFPAVAVAGVDDPSVDPMPAMADDPEEPLAP
jgi:hypothetical protein